MNATATQRRNARMHKMFERAKLQRIEAINADLADETTAAKIGEEIAALLNLKARTEPTWNSPRFETSGGTKSACGLARTVANIFGL